MVVALYAEAFWILHAVTYLGLLYEFTFSLSHPSVAKIADIYRSPTYASRCFSMSCRIQYKSDQGSCHIWFYHHFFYDIQDLVSTGSSVSQRPPRILSKFCSIRSSLEAMKLVADIFIEFAVVQFHQMETFFVWSRKGILSLPSPPLCIAWVGRSGRRWFWWINITAQYVNHDWNTTSCLWTVNESCCTHGRTRFQHALYYILTDYMQHGYVTKVYTYQSEPLCEIDLSGESLNELSSWYPVGNELWQLCAESGGVGECVANAKADLSNLLLSNSFPHASVDPWHVGIKVLPSRMEKCLRCWKRTAFQVETLCTRCASTVNWV